MIPLAPTADEVRAFYAYLPGRFGARVAQKADSEAMKACARFLALLKIGSADAFMSSYCTTIPDVTGQAGAAIYVPFEPGTPLGGWTLQAQHDLLVHECTHAVQIATDGGLAFALAYLADEMARAMYEARAYATAIELACLRGVTPPDAADLANHLLGYGCSAAAITVAREAIESLALTIGAGALINEASRETRAWWLARAAA